MTMGGHQVAPLLHRPPLSSPEKTFPWRKMAACVVISACVIPLCRLIYPGPSAGPAFTAHAAAEFESQFYYKKCTVQVQCNSPSHPSAGHASTAQLLNSRNNRTTTNALYQCNTIVLLHKALLQGVPSQLMQLLDVKHNLNTRMRCASAVQLNSKQSYYKIALNKCNTTKFATVLLRKCIVQVQYN